MQTSKRIHIPSDKDYIKKLNTIMPVKNYGFDIDFSYYREFFHILNTPCPLDLFNSQRNRIMRAKQTQEIYTKAYCSLSDINIVQNCMPILRKLWAYLAITSELRPCDSIVVVGGKVAQSRGDVVLELLKRGLSQKIIITGDKPFFDKVSQTNEAHALTKYLAINQVSISDIITEDKAQNTTENVYYTYLMLKKINYFPKSIILVANPMQMTRLYYTFQVLGKKYGWLPDILCQPIKIRVDDTDYFKNFDEFCLLLNEYTKLYYSFCQNKE